VWGWPSQVIPKGAGSNPPPAAPSFPAPGYQ
jgi:hypothetical protein